MIGVETLPFRNKMLEDHGVQILLLKNKISLEELRGYKKSKEIIRGENLINLIECSNIEYVKEAFCHMECLIKAIESKLTFKVLISTNDFPNCGYIVPYCD